MYALAESLVYLGSPPLTRELHVPGIDIEMGDRITPAYAGTTSLSIYFQHEIEDHPRLRGNYRVPIQIYKSGQGSPPLTRELLSPQLSIVDRDGITPAYAGTTSAAQWHMGEL